MRFLSLSSNTLRNLLGPTSISPLFQSNSLVFCFYLFVIIYFRYDNFLFSSINLRNLFQPTSFSKRPSCYIYASFLFLIRFPLFSSISYKKNCFNPSYFISDAIFIPLVDKFKKVYLTSRLSQSARHTSYLSVDKIFILLVD